jgi:hypothetical protein
MSGRLHPRLLTFIGVALFPALSGLSNAQQTATQSVVGQTQTTTASGPATLVKEVAYSADLISETTRPLADGTQITHKSLTKMFRDSEGRTRSETYGTAGGSSHDAGALPRFISISDPVAGVHYMLNPQNQTARRVSMTPHVPAPAQKPPSPASSSAERSTATREDLGQREIEREIEGVIAHGFRITRTIPVGAEGNDRPIVITEEQWNSHELHQMVLVTVDNPLEGRTVQRLSNIVREEPSPDLFQVPADYTIT